MYTHNRYRGTERMLGAKSIAEWQKPLNYGIRRLQFREHMESDILHSHVGMLVPMEPLWELRGLLRATKPNRWRGDDLKLNTKMQCILMWWTLNSAPHLIRVCKFGCRALYDNQLTGSIPNNVGNLMSHFMFKIRGLILQGMSEHPRVMMHGCVATRFLQER